MGQKWVGLCLFFWGSWVPIEHKLAWAEAYNTIQYENL